MVRLLFVLATLTASPAIFCQTLTATLVGPNVPITVNADAAGPMGDGLLLADVTLSASTESGWSVATLTFVASGTASHNTSYSELALWEDNGNGLWDGAIADVLAAPPVSGGFNSGSLDRSFTLSSTPLAANQTRRFFLAGKLNGSATAGQTLNARLEAVSATSTTTPGQITGVPTVASSALVIDVAVLLVESGVGKPQNVTHSAGAVGEVLMAHFRLSAINNVISINSLALTTAGTGNWSADVDALQLYRDDGDGLFQQASETLLAITPGGTILSPVGLSVAHGQSIHLWIVADFSPAAGFGAAATPSTYSFSIGSSTDVGTNGATVILSAVSPPTSCTVSLIDFFVSSFSPLSAEQAGGSAITITGSGFLNPLQVRIGGVVCSGVAVVAGGFQITGLTVPPGVGQNLPIEMTVSGLAPQTLPVTFDYRAPSPSPSIIEFHDGFTIADDIEAGLVPPGGKVHVVTLLNLSTSTLALTDTPPATIIGTHNAGPLSEVRTQPNATVLPGGETTLTVFLQPAGDGTMWLNIQLPSNLAPGLDFFVRGTIATEPFGSGSSGDGNDEGCTSSPHGAVTALGMLLVTAAACRAPGRRARRPV